MLDCKKRPGWLVALTYLIVELSRYYLGICFNSKEVYSVKGAPIALINYLLQILVGQARHADKFSQSVLHLCQANRGSFAEDQKIFIPRVREPETAPCGDQVLQVQR